MKGLEQNLIKIVAVISVLFLATACSTARNEKPVTKTNFVLDTIVQVSAYGPNASDVIDEVFGRILEIDSKMTAVGDDSEVIRLNKAAGVAPQKVSQDTFYVIKKGLFYSNISSGKFDITIGPLVKLWGIGTERARVPSKSEIDEVLRHINYADVILDEEESSVMLKNKGMSLDLGGIAKGYAADESIRILNKKGVKSAAVDLGGNVYVLGKKPDGRMWKIGLQDPLEPRGSAFATVEVADKTLVTSGIYERYFEKDNIRYHHILNTTTGYPVENDLIGVTIISDSSIDADALSTTVFAKGLRDGIEFIEGIPNVDAVFVTKDRKVYKTMDSDRYHFELINNNFKMTD